MIHIREKILFCDVCKDNLKAIKKGKNRFIFSCKCQVVELNYKIQKKGH